ncbi:uncharacterized protein BO97DRAFT_46291 [Aspergillus homomorphus CBS 101889]|uniref:Diaminopimelate epimerase-like protein n=1 Tax=Aspergillus homomorphus (strain CBS 101889) TaxID=1450537 RepID=A0A395I0T0_ASPHC|nr:hypothetical protein BO97DRAFT_46291 [Aspergillus homomorphus CBS 101889]RAL13279.1 hypothetical protein BO97DRAFT_46291 [Aspergillus homomorphus CBS 101889]
MICQTEILSCPWQEESCLLLWSSPKYNILSGLAPGPNANLDLDEEWAPSFTGTMYYRLIGMERQSRVAVWTLRVRMIAINLEDPACGSGACSLGAHLALSHAHGSRIHRFKLDQGVEMGRYSRIVVEICLDEERRRLLEVKLAGHAVVVAEGILNLD